MQDFKFVRVEDYFGGGWDSWDRLEEFVSEQYHNKNGDATVEIRAKSAFTGKEHVVVVSFLAHNTFRVRFDPKVTKVEQYTIHNSRAVVEDTIDELRKALNDLNVKRTEKSDRITYLVSSTYNKLDPKDGTIKPFLELDIVTGKHKDKPLLGAEKYASHFYLRVTRLYKGRRFVVWTSDRLYFKPSVDKEFNVVQTIAKPPAAQYVGFSEQGGLKLMKNDDRLTYFNYDNMRYTQVYNSGPFESREPLYHSDPFFIEFNGTSDSAYEVPNPSPSATVYDDDQFYNLFGTYIDNPSQVSIDVGYYHSHVLSYGTRFGGIDYYVFFGKNVAKVTSAYTAVVGRSKLKPRYALGYHQGCYGYENKADLAEVARAYRYHEIPLDGLAVDVDVQNKYQTFTINTAEDKFANPAEFFGWLRSIGIKCCTNITPVISNQDPTYRTYREGYDKGYFLKDVRVMDGVSSVYYQDYRGGAEYDSNHVYPRPGKSERPLELKDINHGDVYQGEVWYGGDRGTTGHYPDLYRKDVRAWWGQQYQYLFDNGMEFIWQDMTTPAIVPTRGDMRSFPFRLKVKSDWICKENTIEEPVIRVWNLYSYNLHKATYHGLNNLKGRENKRNFIVGRGSFSGMHRYAALWTGDNESSWSFFRINVAQALSQGLSGVTLNGQDIGGFEAMSDQEWCDPELLIRWTAVGAFLPWFRNHYIRKWNNGKLVKAFQEPYKYHFSEDQFNHYQVPHHQRNLYHSVLPVTKYFIKLRYRLLQVFYDALFENLFNGLPISRMLIINEPGDKALYTDRASFLNYQFFVRKDLLVAATLHPSSERQTVDIYFPIRSNWYQYMDNKRPLQLPQTGGTTYRGYSTYINNDDQHIPFTLPIYVRSGAILPTLDDYNYVGERKRNILTFNIYPGESDNKETTLTAYDHRYYVFKYDPALFDVDHDGEYFLFQDDGESLDATPNLPQFKGESAPSKYRQTFISTTHSKTGSPSTKNIVFKRLVDNYVPPEPFFYVAVLHDPRENADPIDAITINKGKPLWKHQATNVASQNANALASTPDDVAGWYYNQDVRISFIKVPDVADASKTIEIVVTYKK